MPHAFASVSWLLMNQLYMCCLGVCRLECIPMWPGKNTLIYFNETTRPLRVHGTHSLVRPINSATASHLNSMHSLPCSQCLSANPAIRLSTDRQTERPEVLGGGGGGGEYYSLKCPMFLCGGVYLIMMVVQWGVYFYPLL